KQILLARTYHLKKLEACPPAPLQAFSLAERAGFEPAMEFDPHTRLAGECLQPLGHLSGETGCQCRACWVTAWGGIAASRRSDLPRRDGCGSARAYHLGGRGRVAERLNAAVLKTVRRG